MPKLNFVLNLMCVSIFVLSSFFMQSMEHFNDFNYDKFKKEIKDNNVQAIESMFKSCINEHAKRDIGLHFVDVRTIEIAQLFVTYDCFKFYCERANENYPYLENICRISYPLELMKFCFENGVSPHKSTIYTNKNLLHTIAFADFPSDINDEDVEIFLEKTKYLLKLISYKINVLSTYNASPLDIAYAALKKARNKKEANAFKQLIELFKQHGALEGKNISR